MIEIFAKKFSRWIISKTGDDTRYDILVYGAECFISEVIANLVLFLFAFVFNIPIYTLVWLIGFLLSRIWFGGYHAKSHFLCIVYSTIIGILCVQISLGLPASFFMLPVEIVPGLLTAFSITPVTHPHHPISSKQRRIFAHRSRLFALLISGTILFLFISRQFVYAHLLGMGLLSSTVLCWIGFFCHRFRRKQTPN